jgi:ribosomal protein L37AE/L43A
MLIQGGSYSSSNAVSRVTPMEIAITCPQCGAEVDLAEEDTVFRCLYCGSTLKPTGRNRVQSFFISPRETTQKVGRALIHALKAKGPRKLHISEHHLLYAPYWRVNGMIFQWLFGRRYFNTPNGDRSWEDLKKLRATPWVHTFPAFDASKWSLFSLGLRVQALKIWPFNRAKIGQDSLLLRQTISFKNAADHAQKSITKQAASASLQIEMAISELIGERYSLLYFPFYCFKLSNNGRKSMLIVDGLSHKVIKGEVNVDNLKSNTSGGNIPYRPINFLPYCCPNCGWEFSYRPHTVIHFCKSCCSAWQEHGGRYVSVPYRISLDDNPIEKNKYLAFWRLSLVIKAPDREYGTVKEFYELFPLPRLVDQEALKDRKISFYIPAFRIRNAIIVDTFASRLTKMQPTFNESQPDSIEELDLSDVWLQLKEAKEMAHVLLYSMTKATHRRTKEVVKGAHLHITETRLLCLPFTERGIYLREVQTDLALQRNALDLD